MTFEHNDSATLTTGYPSRRPAAARELRATIAASRNLRAELHIAVAASRKLRENIAQERMSRSGKTP